MTVQYRQFRIICLALLACAGTTVFAQSDIVTQTIEPQAAPREPVIVPVLKPLEVHSRASLSVVEQLRYNHYVKKPLDDGISSDIFDKYLDTLDGGRAYFLMSDIVEFEQYRYMLDDALKRANLDPAFTIYNRYQTRAVERLEYLLDQLDSNIEDLDFSVDETIEIDRENASWPRSQIEQDDFWRRRLKAAVLGMKLNGKDFPEIQELLSKRYKNRLKQTTQIKSEDAFQLYINAFASTYDPHTQYFSPRTSQNFNINMSLSLEGIGAVLRSEDDYTSVVRLVPAGPADKAGDLQPADRIIGVGQGPEGALIDIVGWRLDDVVELIRGPKDSTVRLEIVSSTNDSDESRVIQITRNTVQLEEQAAQAKLLTLNDGVEQVRLGVIDVPTFYIDFKASQQGDPNYRSTTRDVAVLIDQLKSENIDGLIIDLRSNGGGSLQEADSLTGLFIESGPTVQVKSNRRRPSVYSDTDASIAWDGPLAVMVNRLSASASEIFAGAIQDYGRGIILGSQTFGKGTVQTLIPLIRGQLKITAAKFYRVSGQSTQHQGIIPDITFPELFDADQIGESSLDDAMPWDMIQPAVYNQSNEIQSLLGELQKRHFLRTEDDVEFNYYRAWSKKSKENSGRTHLSLNESTRLKEKEENDAWELALENTRRSAKGKLLADSLEHLQELRDAETSEEITEEKSSQEVDDATAQATTQQQSTLAEKQPEPLAEVEGDAMIEEAGRILLDVIRLSDQIARLEPDAPVLGSAMPRVEKLKAAGTEG